MMVIWTSEKIEVVGAYPTVAEKARMPTTMYAVLSFFLLYCTPNDANKPRTEMGLFARLLFGLLLLIIMNVLQ